MKPLIASLMLTGSALSVAFAAAATEYETEIIIEGLASPTGISVGSWRSLYFTEVPDPGISGENGGANTVKRYDLYRETTTTISDGEPYPLNLAVNPRGTVYWTCQSAGVILRYDVRRDEKSFFLPSDIDEDDPSLLLSPTGIAVHHRGDVLFTELPDPGNKGANMVSVSNGEDITVLSSSEPAPYDIAVAWDGTAYWTCQTAGVIVRKTPTGLISIIKSDLEAPTGIAIDRRGRNLYYTELPTPGVPGLPDNDQGGTNRVVKLDLRTMETDVISTGFPYPQDVTVAWNGKVYWTCKTVGVIACATPKHRNRRFFFAF